MNINEKLRVAAALLAMLPLAAMAQASTPPTSSDAGPNSATTAPSGQATTVTPADRRFVAMAAQGGLAEVALSREALENSHSDAVKAFAQQMVTDHTKANAQLAGVVSEDGIPMPSEPDVKHQALSRRLAKLNGPAFDQAYAEAMIQDHDKTVALFDTEIAKGKDPGIVAWTKQTLPVIQEHDKMAHTLPAGPAVSQ